MGEMDAPRALALYELAKADEELRETIERQCLDVGELYAALPFEHGFEMPAEGAWIMVKRQPHTAIPSPPFGSIWRARAVFYSRSFVGLPLGGRTSRAVSHWPMLRARISTPAGELTLLPDEFVIVQQMVEWTRDIGKGVTLHLLGGGASAEGDLAERVFYCRARGIAQADALALFLPEVDEPGFAWLNIDGVGDDAGYLRQLEEHAAAA